MLTCDELLRSLLLNLHSDQHVTTYTITHPSSLAPLTYLAISVPLKEATTKPAQESVMGNQWKVFFFGARGSDVTSNPICTYGTVQPLSLLNIK